MKIPVFALAALLLGIIAQNVQSAPTADENTNMDLKQFNENFNKVDNLSPKEKEEEEKTLKEAEKDVEENNKLYEEGRSTYRERLYAESSESSVEFLTKHTGINPSPAPRKTGQIQRSLGILPIDKDELNTPENLAKIEEVNRQLDREYPDPPATYNDDVTNLKFVTKAKAQGDCGSCAAFGEAALLETAMLKAGAKMEGMDLSEQYLVDCAYGGKDGGTYGISGCDGAVAGGYTKWFVDNGGEGLHEGDYPYRGSDENALNKCKNKAKNIKMWSSGYKVTDPVVAYRPSEKKIKQMIQKFGAVMSVIEVAGSFGNYATGVWSDRTKKCRTAAQLKPNQVGYNHAILIVGWGREMNTDYWMVKNSWGNNWGNNGFIKVKMGICWIGEVGVWAVAKKIGEADAAPAVDDKEDEAPALWCDMNERGYTVKDGSFKWEVDGYSPECTWKALKTEVKCVAATQKCKPLRPGPMNGCRYIFGKPKEDCTSDPPKTCTLKGYYSGYTGSLTFRWYKFVDNGYWVEEVEVRSTGNCNKGVCDKLCKDLCNKDDIVCWT